MSNLIDEFETTPIPKYEPHEIYSKVGNEWVSVSELFKKQDAKLLFLVDIFGTFLAMMDQVGGNNISCENIEYFTEQLVKLRRELKCK